jgi:hypothetical protein
MFQDEFAVYQEVLSEGARPASKLDVSGLTLF